MTPAEALAIANAPIPDFSKMRAKAKPPDKPLNESTPVGETRVEEERAKTNNVTPQAAVQVELQDESGDEDKSGVVTVPNTLQTKPCAPAGYAEHRRSWIVWYLSQGLHPIRVHSVNDACKAPGKQPICAGWQKIAPDSPDAYGPDDLVGWKMGRQPNGRLLIAIDVDSPDSDAELSKISPLKTWPNTLAAETPKAGLHAVYEWPASVPLPSNRVRLPGTQIDLRSEGGQIVVAPSWHATGSRSWIAANVPIAPLPEELARRVLELSGEKKANAVNGAGAVDFLATFTKDLADAFARTFPERGERHKACLDLAGMLIRRGWSEERAAACLESVLRQTGWEYSPVEARNDVATTLQRAQSGQAYAGRTALDQTLQARGQGDVVGPFEDTLNLLDAMQKNKEGAIRPSLANLSLVFSRHPAWVGALALDTFSQKIIKRTDIPTLPDERPHEFKSDWVDADSSRTATWLSSVYRMTVASGTVADKVRDAAYARAFHPVREYLTGLKWDGVPRIHTLFSRGFGAHETAYTSAISRYFMIGAVARVMTLGATKLDTVPILVGEQGTFKSSGLRALVPDEGWFADTPIDMHNKDSMLAVQGVWIYELAELAKMKDSDVELVKAFVSRSVDRFRVPYGRGVESFERQVALIATTNELKLRDTTGNRRFWPVQCLKNTDVAWIKVNRAQLWAEALDAQSKGGQWWATEEIEVLCKAEQDDSLEQEPWHDEIAKHLAALCAPTVRTDVSAFATDTTDPWEGITTGQILSKAVGKTLEHRTSHDTQSVINTFRSLGWKPWPTSNGKRRVNGVVLRVWIPPTEKPEGWARGAAADNRMSPVVLQQY
jgi:hypothetical protein